MIKLIKIFLNYVIQNFYKIPSNLTLIPRINFLFILNNISKIFFFFKFNLNTFFFNTHNYFLLTHRFHFFKYFFQKQLFKINKKINFKIIGFYNNKLKQSLIYHIFAFLFKILIISNQNIKFLNYAKLIPVQNELFYNSYFFAIKVLKEKINTDVYRNFFFFLFFFSSSFWYQHYSFTKFYLNFIHILKNFNFFFFFNSYFLKIHNY